jgi:hypothetical protein
MQETGIHRQLGLILIVVLVAFGIVGCGGSGRPKTIPITGLVKIDGKEPGEAGMLYFVPTKAAEGYAKRPANGSFNNQGKYRIMSWEVDDGLVPGHYTVTLVPGDPAKSAIPTKYRSNTTSGLELDVTADQGKVVYDIEVHTK